MVAGVALGLEDDDVVVEQDVIHLHRVGVVVRRRGAAPRGGLEHGAVGRREQRRGMRVAVTHVVVAGEDGLARGRF